MPTALLTAEQARAIADYVVNEPLAPIAPKEVPSRLPVAADEVSFATVQERVFRRVCWHCHSDPSLARGDGGPGHTGGFGFPARGVNLAEHRYVLGGYRADDGHRRSLFEEVVLPAEAGSEAVPRLIAVLVARWYEEAGRPLPGLRGMPLGLPALTPEDVQLVETWIAQGRRD